MKRIHLFELEDFSWFPNWIRTCMTRLIVVVHRLMGTSEDLAEIVAKTLKASDTNNIVDLCSGSGGPMPEVIEILDKKYGLKNIQLTLTDLYPNLEAAERFNSQSDNISYETQAIDVTNISTDTQGLRTMISSFHHIRPDKAKQILASAQSDKQPICIFEISDNSVPIILAILIALPINFLMCFFITPFARPFTWQQFVFTYLIPIIPLCFAWDGAITNARIYTLKDMDELLEGLESENYTWEKNIVKGKIKKLYLIGLPV